MHKTGLTLSIAVVCTAWGVAVLTHQHHLSALIPTLGYFLLMYGIGLTILAVLFGRRS